MKENNISPTLLKKKKKKEKKTPQKIPHTPSKKRPT